mmetsp:Transcript_48166/g.90198  ORF Transcript_48166/g.90198 Transcript_48166/m.90198 type:complete len:945 (+) Transcript_48166:123-2957(+)
MQTIGAHMNNAASAAIEGKKTMQKDLGRGGPKAMAWFFFLVCGFAMLVKIFDSFLFGEDQSGIGEICLFGAFVLGIALSRLNFNWQDRSAKLMQPIKRQGKGGAESPQPSPTSAKATYQAQSSSRSVVRMRKFNPQSQREQAGTVVGVDTKGTTSIPPWRAASQRRRANLPDNVQSSGHASPAELLVSGCNSISVEIVQSMFDSGAAVDAAILMQGIVACCKSGKIELAEKWLGHLLHLPPGALKSITFEQIHSIVEEGIKAGGARKVAAWIGQLHAGGLQPHAKTLVAALQALVDIKEIAQAEQLLSRMEAADAHVDSSCYQLLFEHCIPVESTENVARAEMWLKRIGRRGRAELAQGYAALIRARGSPIFADNQQEGSALVAKGTVGIESVGGQQVEFWMMHALAAGVTRSTQCYNAVIHAFTKVGDIERAEVWLDRMESAAKEAPEEQSGAVSGAGFSPDVYSYSAIMDAYAQRGETARAEACFERMQASGVRPDAVSFNTVVKAHARSGNISGAEQWLMRAHRQAVQVDAYGYNAIIAAAARCGDPKTAEHWLIRMLQDGACPDVVSYNSVINAWAKHCNAVRAERLVDMMCENSVEPDVVTLGAAVHACAKAGDMVRAEGIFARIVARGCTQPDAICYNAMIDAFVKVRETQKAEEWLSAMIKDGVTPSVVSYTTVLHAHARAGDIEAAENGLERMVAHGIEANVVSYSALIHACVKAGNIDRAEKWFERMQAAGVKPNVVSYSVILNVCAKAGEVARAERWMENMRAADVMPNVVCFNNVIDACARAGRGDRAEAWLRRLIEASRAQQAEGSVQRSVARMGSGDAKIGVPEGGLAPTRQSYTTAAQAFATHGLWNDVERLFAEMEDAGLSTDEFSLTVMLSAYSRARPRQRERAEIAFRRHIIKGLPITKPPMRALRSALGAQRSQQLCNELNVHISD